MQGFSMNLDQGKIRYYGYTKLLRASEFQSPQILPQPLIPSTLLQQIRNLLVHPPALLQPILIYLISTQLRSRAPAVFYKQLLALHCAFRDALDFFVEAGDAVREMHICWDKEALGFERRTRFAGGIGGTGAVGLGLEGVVAGGVEEGFGMAHVGGEICSIR